MPKNVYDFFRCIFCIHIVYMLWIKLVPGAANSFGLSVEHRTAPRMQTFNGALICTNYINIFIILFAGINECARVDNHMMNMTRRYICVGARRDFVRRVDRDRVRHYMRAYELRVAARKTSHIVTATAFVRLFQLPWSTQSKCTVI